MSSTMTGMAGLGGVGALASPWYFVLCIVGAVLGVVGIVALWRWWFVVDVGELRQEVSVAIDSASAELRDMLFRAQRAADPPDASAQADDLLKALDELRTRAKEATSDELEALKREIRWVNSRRAYLVPAAAIDFEAQSKADDLRTWRLPAEVTDGMAAQLQALRSVDASKSLERRMRLEGIYDEFDYWDEYSDWYIESSLYPTMVVVAGIFAISLGLSMLFLLRWHQTVIGFILAGGSGAALSILLKLPPMSVYGDAVGAGARMVARFAAGVAATAMGFGLLSTGFVNVGVRSQNSQFVGVSELLQSCTGDTACTESQTQSASAKEGAVLSLATIGDTPSNQTRVPPTEGTAGQRSGCEPANVMLLLAMGIVFGFSERALSSFESVVMPPTAPKGGSAASPGPTGNGSPPA